MSLKRTMIVISIIMIGILSIFAYKEIKSKELEITELKVKIASLENQILEVNAKSEDKIIDKSRVVLKQGSFDIDIYSGYGSEFPIGNELYISKPAFGPLCSLNRSAVENSDNVRIVGEENGYLTRISVEGVIPTWVLKPANGIIETYYVNKQMYVIKDSNVFLTPEDNSKKVNLFGVGKAVRVIDEYNDWMYINTYTSNDANEICKGWIKKTNVGYYDSLKTNIGVEVKIKKGYEPEWAKEYAQIAPYGLWGEIMSETAGEFDLLLYGGSSMKIKKDQVQPFFRN